MDQHDQELLDKQIRQIDPAPRNDGVMMLAIVAVFFAGITLGGVLVGYEAGPTRIAANDVTATASFLKGAAPPMPQ